MSEVLEAGHPDRQDTQERLRTKWREILIEDANLSSRTKNALRSGGLYRLGEVADASVADLLRIPNLGRLSLQEIEGHVASWGGVAGTARERLQGQICSMERRRQDLLKEIGIVERIIEHANRRLGGPYDPAPY